MSFLNKYVFVLVLLLAFSLRADVIKEIENYIQSRINGTPVKETGHCAFRHQLDLKLNLQRLSPQLKKRAVQLLSEPERQQSVVSPSGHFTLHFDISGYHAVPPEDSLGNGIPDYIDSAMVIFDHVWDVEINRLGFQPPPAPDGGARENYHVYFSKSYEYYGWTTPDQQISTSRGTTYTSFLEINANFFKTNFYTGGLDAMAHDLAIPEEYGIYHTVGDTAGPGGWARTIRNFDVFVSLAEAIKRLAPGAVVLNYTNPMTTLTTVLGLLPMALGLGEGAEVRAPMAITVIGGLTVSTLLTLLFVPTVYLVAEQLRALAIRVFAARQAAVGSAEQ